MFASGDWPPVAISGQRPRRIDFRRLLTLGHDLDGGLGERVAELEPCIRLTGRASLVCTVTHIVYLVSLYGDAHRSSEGNILVFCVGRCKHPATVRYRTRAQYYSMPLLISEGTAAARTVEPELQIGFYSGARGPSHPSGNPAHYSSTVAAGGFAFAYVRQRTDWLRLLAQHC